MDRKLIESWESEELEREAGESGRGALDEARGSDLFDVAWQHQSRRWQSPVARLTTVHDSAVIYLEGEIGIPEFQYLEQVFESLLGQQLTKIVISFAAVEHLNYKVFQQLMRVAKRLRREAGDLRFSQISQYLYHIFLFSGADQTIDHFRDVEEALLSFHTTHGRSWH